jgi:hypothetical protein
MAILIVSAFAINATFAADPLTDAMQAAYRPYREALFNTNSNSQVEARDAIIQAKKAWSELTIRFAIAPPLPYDRDRSFGTSVAAVSKVYAKALEQVASNQLSAARETLEAARDVLANGACLSRRPAETNASKRYSAANRTSWGLDIFGQTFAKHRDHQRYDEKTEARL